MQTADCRMQSADRIQNVDCRLQSGYKMQTENLKCFFVWYVINYILQLTERHAIAFLRSASTVICTIVEYSWPFFLNKIVLNIISSLHIESSHFARELFGVMSVQILPT